MKQDWEIKTIGDVCEFGNGLWTGKKPPYQNVGVIRNTNFTKDGKLDDSNIVYLDVEQKQFAKRKLQFGDIILEKSGGGPKQPVGRVIVFDKKKGDFSFSNFTSVIRIMNDNAVDFNYVHRFLYFKYISGATEKMQSHSTGIRNLKFDDYKAIEIPIPPYTEQKRIVALLDEAFEKINKVKANTEKNLANAKELFESYLSNIFVKLDDDWEIKTIGDVCEFGNGLWTGKKPPYQNVGVIRNTNFTKDGKLDDSNIVYLDVEQKQFAKRKLQFGDIILEKSGGGPKQPVGRVIVFDKKKGDFSFSNFTSVIRIMNDNAVDFNYVHRFLYFKYISGATEKMQSHSTGIRNLKFDDYKAIEIPIPPYTEQKRIVKKLDLLSAESKKLETIYKTKLRNLEEFKKSILQKAFAGELDTSKIRVEV
ncbi:MAG: restriction endonuclease subunit S [Chryseobacterium sp.]